MNVGSTVEDALAIESLIQELALPIGRGRSSVRHFDPSVAGPTRNRRRAPRVNLVADDVVVLIDGESVSVVDFSVGGIQVRSNTRLMPGSTVMLTIQWRDDQKSSVALGRVLWAVFEKPHMFAQPHYRLGALFEQSNVQMLRQMVARYELSHWDRAVEVVQSSR